MTPFQRAEIPRSEIDLIVEDLLKKPPQWFEKYLGPNPTAIQIRDYINTAVEQLHECETWKNDVYQVQKREFEIYDGRNTLVELSIKRLDREPCRDWREFQQIKNMLAGPENEGVELYPAESRLVDSANQYFLYVLTDPKARWPFGITPPGRIATEDTVGKSVQRKFNE